MTVRAKHPKIFYPMVITDPIDVVDLNADGLTPPLRYPTQAATIFKYTSLKQVPLNGRTWPADQYEVQWPAASPCAEISPIYGLCPRCSRESEKVAALPV
jgi:hypothetical protein